MTMSEERYVMAEQAGIRLGEAGLAASVPGALAWESWRPESPSVAVDALVRLLRGKGY